MATIENTYTGNGSTTNYTFTFEYLQQSDVKVTLDGTASTAFTFANATTLSFTTAPGNGVAIRIYRDTDVDTLKATFFPGSAIKAEDLNNNYTQNNFAAQESKAASSQAPTALANSQAAVVTANSAAADAAAALTAASNAVNYAPVTNVASIPTSPSDGDYIEVFNSTGIESFTPLAGLPVGFVGDSGLSARLNYTAATTTWNWIDYIANDADSRYLKQTTASSTYLTQTSAASTYMTQADGLETADLGVTVQAYDADTAKLDVAQTFTADQTFNTPVSFPSTQTYPRIPANFKSAAYTLVASDAGKFISITTGGITIPADVFSTGDAISVYNRSTSSQTITPGTNVVLRQAGTANLGNRTIAQYGVATLLCVSSNVFAIMGAGVS